MVESTQPILLIGAGSMAVEYAKVFSYLGLPFRVLGRGAASAAKFADATGVEPSLGDLSSQLSDLRSPSSNAVVAVNAMHLADVSTTLVRHGVTRLLVEKPGVLDASEATALQAEADRGNAEVFIGYNRRFMPSVLMADDLLAEDGGPVTVKFDFSEPVQRIMLLDKPRRELETWFYGNSSHVVDLALHFAGNPRLISSYTTGEVVWGGSPAGFAGAGVSDRGVLLSWHASWVGPGRWGVEVVSPVRRLILQPLESLRIQEHTSFAEVEAPLSSEPDGLKPGLLGQVRAFLYGERAERLVTLGEQVDRWEMLERIRSGTAQASLARDQTNRERHADG